MTTFARVGRSLVPTTASARYEPPPDPDVAAPSAPANLAVEAIPDGQGLRLSWDDNDPAEGVHHYNIYRSLSSPVDTNVAPKAVQDISDYDDVDAAEDTTYFYVVTAVDQVGNESAVSNEASGSWISLALPAAFAFEHLMDEGSGQTVADSDPNGNGSVMDMTLGNTANAEADDPTWEAGPYLSFNGGQVLQANNGYPAGFGVTDAWSISTLVRLGADTTTEQALWHLGRESGEIAGEDEARMSCVVEEGLITVHLYNGTTIGRDAISLSTAGITSQWFLMTVTHDGAGTLTFYVNDTEISLHSNTSTVLLQHGLGFHIGAVRNNDDVNFDRYFLGDVAWNGMANGVLTPAEVTQTYEYVQGVASGKGITI